MNPRGFFSVCVAACALWLSGCEDAQDHIHRARALTFEKKPELALKQYRLALDLIERDETPAAKVHQARALKGAADVYYLELRDFRRAVEVYEELIRDCPEAPESLEARVRLADILQTQFHNTRGAINALVAAIERNPPESAELIYRVAKLYFELGDFQQVTLEAVKVQKQFEASAFVDDAMLLEAQALAMMEGRQSEALRVMEQLVEKFPDSQLVPFALYEMGKAKADSGDREEAITLWVRALQTHPDPPMVQGSINRVRKQIIERSPATVSKQYAFDHAARKAIVVPASAKTSLEAMGAPREEAATETGD